MNNGNNKEPTGDVGSFNLLTVNIGTQIFGVDVFKIKEIIPNKGVNSLPFQKEHILGVVNVRGESTPVINLPYIFKKDINNEHGYFVIVESAGSSYALLVNEVLQIHNSVNNGKGKVGSSLSPLILASVFIGDSIVNVLNIDHLVVFDKS